MSHPLRCQNCETSDAVFLVAIGPGHTEKLCQDCKERIVGGIISKMYEADSVFRDLVDRNQIDYFAGTNWPAYPRWHMPFQW